MKNIINLHSKSKMTIALISAIIVFSVNCNAKVDGSVFATLERVSEDSVYFAINNKLDDTIYFFDSYRSFDYTVPNNRYSMSEYLHKYNPKTKKFTLSLTPIYNRLMCGRPSLVVVGSDGVERGYARFVFRHIPPQSTVTVSLPMSSILMSTYIEDVDLNDAKYYKKNNIPKTFSKIPRYECNGQSWLTIDFAYYYHDSLVHYVEDPIVNYSVTEEMVMSYNIFSISLLISN